MVQYPGHRTLLLHPRLLVVGPHLLTDPRFHGVEPFQLQWVADLEDLKTSFLEKEQEQ